MIKNRLEDIDLQNFDCLLSDLGLILDSKTGGFYVETFQGKVSITKHDHSEKYEIIRSDQSKILFFNGSIFLKSLKDTEDSFNIKLFI